jgi:hypothetical protein
MTKTAPLAFDVHPGVAMVRKWADELPAKTGRTLDEWGRLVERQKFASKAVATDWLKAEYGLGTMTAGQVVEFAMGQQTWDGTPEIYLRNAAVYVQEMFAKGKEWQRPIFDEVVAFVRTLGPDVKVCPCKTIVPFYRTRVFGELKPATKTRLELSFALGEVADVGRLVRNPRAKGNDRLRHMVALTPDAGFDAACKKWLKAAYKADAA